MCHSAGPNLTLRQTISCFTKSSDAYQHINIADFKDSLALQPYWTVSSAEREEVGEDRSQMYPSPWAKFELWLHTDMHLGQIENSGHFLDNQYLHRMSAKDSFNMKNNSILLVLPQWSSLSMQTGKCEHTPPH